MARPSQAEEAELERLESMAALLSAVEDACDVIDLRFRQSQRRAMGNAYLLKVLGPVADEMETFQVHLGHMRDLLAEILAAKQSGRVRQNNGEKP